MDGAPPSSARVPDLVTRLGGSPIPTLVVALAAALVGSAVLFGGNSGDGAVPWVGGAAVLLASAVLVGRSLGLIELPLLERAGTVAVASLVALVVWAGCSIAWSVAGDHSWSALNKGIAYACFVVVGLACCSVGTGTTRAVGGLLATVLGAALAWALAGKAIPALGPSDLLGVTRLQSPVGYANGLALLADAAIGLGLWLAVATSPRRATRAAGAILVYLAVLALMLTSSRAGEVAGIVVLALWLWLGEARLESGVAALVAAIPAGVVGGWAFTRPALVESGATHAGRVHDGAVFGVAAVVGAVVVALASVLPSRVVPGRERLVGRALVGVAVVAIVAGIAAAAVSGAHRVSQGECTNDPARGGSLCLNNRLHWWGEAWRIFTARPLGGAGAGTFEIARTQVRRNGDPVSEPHSVPLQVLAGGGIVGGVLLVVFVGSAGLAIVRSVRRLERAERAAAVALVGLPVAYALHALVDFDLDFLALTGPTLFVSGVLFGAGRPLARGGGVLPALAVAGIALAAIGSLASPWLAGRRIDSATTALENGNLARASADANSARALNPLAPDPLYALGEAANRSGDTAAARAYFERATRLQPENTNTWYQLGLFEFYGAKDLCRAYKAFNHAYTLDQHGREWTKGGLLDQSRDAVNDRHACGG
jgi:hypothetical protein